MDYTIKIARFELYPSDEPTSYCVGFSVTCDNNGRTTYADTQVSLANAKGLTDQAIADLAYQNVKASLDAWCAANEPKSPLIGEPYVPQP